MSDEKKYVSLMSRMTSHEESREGNFPKILIRLQRLSHRSRRKLKSAIKLMASMISRTDSRKTQPRGNSA